jgi:DnaJ-class molecular chaperone
MDETDPHRILGLEAGATPAEIRAAFRAALRRSHPDTAPRGTDSGDVRRVIEAYRELIGNARSRSGDTGSTPSVPPAGASRPCPACLGTGIRPTVAPCTSCGGSGGITDLSGPRGRVIRCGDCRGAGRVRKAGSCPACSGSGSLR